MKFSQDMALGEVSLSLIPWEALNHELLHSEASCHALVAQLCPTLCDLVDCSPPGSSVHGILQVRILEWVAIPFIQGIFPTQGANWGFRHCRRILCHLSHQR